MMTTLVLHKVDQKRKNDPRRNPSNTNNDQTKNDPTKKDDAKVLLHIGTTPTAPTEDTLTDDDNDGDNNTDDKQVENTEPADPDGQAGSALAYNDDTLTAKEAWDLINKDHLEDNGLKNNKNDMDNSTLPYGLVAISDADFELSNDDESIGACIEHNEEILLNALYCMSWTLFERLE